MRQIGSLENEVDASRFVDFLKTLQISAQAEEDGDQWLIWVKDENHLEPARNELKEFQANPNDQQYLEASQRAGEIRAAEIKKRMEVKKNFRNVRGSWTGPLSKRAPATFYLIIACIAVAVLGGCFPGPTWAKRLLKFADIYDPQINSAFYNIMQGQIWRLVTPIFLHAPWTGGIGSVLHIVFNLYWLRFLGSQIEAKIGWQRFLVIVLVSAVVSNVAQVLATGPNVVGISGVVYALFGYILVRKRDGYQLDQFIVILLFVFLVLDFTGSGMFANVAAWAHAGGLATGAFIGYLPTLLGNSR